MESNLAQQSTTMNQHTATGYGVTYLMQNFVLFLVQARHI
jgi:hypothetical protein